MIGEHMWRAGNPTRSEIKEAFLRFFSSSNAYQGFNLSKLRHEARRKATRITLP
jgi:hypothetical protein